MSVSHPLLKQLKGHILDIRSDSNALEITDFHRCLFPLCVTLEDIFKLGLKAMTPSIFGSIKNDYWMWVNFMYEQKQKFNLPFNISDSIENIKASKKVYTSTGKGRLFIRMGLVKKFLPSLITCFLSDEVLVASMYYLDTSILGNEILIEIFSSLLYEINKIDFKLELKNASFLDETWTLGLYKKYEFVPCKEMGITFVHLQGRAVVVKVEEGSVAAEDNQIEVGDILDELYGRSLYRCKKGMISSLSHQYQGLPVYLSVIKGIYSDGTLYPPLKYLIKNLDIQKIVNSKISSKNKQEDEAQEDLLLPKSQSPTNLKFNLLLLARFIIQKDGSVSQIERAINMALESAHVPIETVMEIKETKVILFNTSQECILSKHFTEISACGRKQNIPDILALVFGNTTCTIADEFHCYVMKAKSGMEVKMILSSVAQGFGRTHWEV